MIRRRFMELAFATVASAACMVSATAWASGARPRGGRADADAALDVALRSLFPNQRHAHAIGRAYLTRYPDRADPRRLRQALGAQIAGVGHGDRNALVRVLERHRREDFAAGRTVVVNNWILSDTEARLCALCALS